MAKVKDLEKTTSSKKSGRLKNQSKGDESEDRAGWTRSFLTRRDEKRFLYVASAVQGSVEASTPMIANKASSHSPEKRYCITPFASAQSM